MRNINSVTITGNLTRDPESRPAGQSIVCDLGVAVNESVKENGEWVERASFFDITVWGNTAEACQRYLTKGSPVAVTGRLRQDRWTNEQGENRSKVKIIAEQVQFTGGGKPSESGDPHPAEVSQDPADAPGQQALGDTGGFAPTGASGSHFKDDVPF